LIGLTEPQGDPDIGKKTGVAKRKSDPTGPRATAKKGLLGVLLSDPRLEANDRKSIQEAHAVGVTVQDLAALTVYEIRLAQACFASKELAAKDLIVAIGKAARHVAAAAQLGQAQAPTGANITITFNGTGPTATHPDAVAPQHDPDVGDIIDTEG